MSHYAVEWRVFTPLTRVTLARVILRTVDGVDYYIALRDADGEERTLGSWDSLSGATGSVVAMYHEETGESIYGDPEVDRWLKVYPQTPLPGVAAVPDDPARDGSRQAAMPAVRGRRR